MAGGRLAGGVDPGREGYLALVGSEGEPEFLPLPYPKGGAEIDAVAVCRVLADWRRRGVRLVWLEHQQAFGRENPVSTWTAAENYGVLKALFAVLKIRTEVVKPADWKRALAVPTDESVKVPSLPRRPKTRDAAALAAWEAEVEPLKKANRAARKRKQEVLKAKAIAKAKRLAPGVDWRPTEKSKNASSGKAEAFLMATGALRASG